MNIYLVILIIIVLSLLLICFYNMGYNDGKKYILSSWLMGGEYTMSNDMENVRIVRFEYCKTCEHYELSEQEAPCDECLENCFNYGTEKPVYYKEKDMILGKKFY